MHLLTAAGELHFGQALMVVAIGVAGGFFLAEIRLAVLVRALKRIAFRRAN